jgi:hypothetical protein
MRCTFKNIVILFFSTIFAAVSVQAADSKSSVLLYISPNDYNYSVHLLHPYYDYWFEQGPLVAPIALDALKAKLGAVAMCTANETADTIIKIKPHLFYNPQLRVYHSKLVATVYSGSGNLLGRYVGEAQQQGFNSVDTVIKYHLNKVYALAMQELIKKLQSNQFAEKSEPQKNLPCGMIGGQEDTKINFY